MRISSQGTEVINSTNIPANASKKVTQEVETIKETKDSKNQNVMSTVQVEQSKNKEDSKETISKENLEKAVNIMNDFLEVQHKSSKFIYHEGLDKYYVKLVDSETEEVIKEIPPERLLDAFYELQKLSGILVDEKI